MHFTPTSVYYLSGDNVNVNRLCDTCQCDPHYRWYWLKFTKSRNTYIFTWYIWGFESAVICIPSRIFSHDIKHFNISNRWNFLNWISKILRLYIVAPFAHAPSRPCFSYLKNILDFLPVLARIQSFSSII
jgi:hypothetical protein